MHGQSSRINSNRVAERRGMCMSSKPERTGNTTATQATYTVEKVHALNQWFDY
jgi:hypothetical protein